jgi:ribosomal protein S6--L-glutamate ligase
VRSTHGPVVLEVNSSPGLEGVETVTDIDVATKIVQFVEKGHAEKPRRRPRRSD